MDQPLPPEIQVTDLPDGVRYRLPLRQLGWWRLFGLVPLAFGTFFAGFAIFWMLGASGLLEGGEISWPRMLFGLFAVPFIAGGLSIIGVGLFILAGHSEVELTRKTLRAIEATGPIRWSRKRSVEKLRRFVVGSARAMGKDHHPTPEFLSEFAGIKAELEKTDQWLLLAPGYPRALLLPLANEMARLCNLSSQTAPVPAEQPAVRVVEETDQGVIPALERPEKPADSPVLLEEDANSLTLTVPPQGIWRGSHGLIIFAFLWCGMTTIGTAFAIHSIIHGDADGWFVLLFLLIFWVIGIGLLLGAIHMGRRRAVLAVVGGRLLVLQSGLFGSKRREWGREEIADLCTGPSGMEVNDKPVPELQVYLPKGEKVGLLGGRSEEELQWLATVLRRALKIASRSETDSDFEEVTEQPAGSKVVREEQAGGITLTVPPAGIWRGSRGLFVMSLCWCAFMAFFSAVTLGAGAPLPFLLFSLLFWGVGIAMLLGAINMGRRRAVLAVVGNNLMVLQTGLFGSKRQHWDGEDLDDICTGPSGLAMSNVPVLELQIHPKKGSKFGLLAGRDDNELAWLATELRRGLRISPEASGEC